MRTAGDHALPVRDKHSSIGLLPFSSDSGTEPTHVTLENLVRRLEEERDGANQGDEHPDTDNDALHGVRREDGEDVARNGALCSSVLSHTSTLVLKEHHKQDAHGDVDDGDDRYGKHGGSRRRSVVLPLQVLLLLSGLRESNELRQQQHGESQGIDEETQVGEHHVRRRDGPVGALAVEAVVDESITGR